ncbi:pantoate--beta-alanine ligase [Pedomonas mirosovicensis]|uniref:pantoate--beta-alanine ligase n=1 Tax=Pedomonas mirosovicensis TaxID=2908641 RepID=UPI0035BBCB00
MTIVRTVADLREMVGAWRKAGLRVALVPTMGALHQGHLSLIEAAKAHADRVVASIFVNPKQFGVNEDLSRYPRQEARDAELLKSAGCDLLFAPTVEEMYPAGFATSVSVAGVSEGLCGAARPGHFDGVALIVTKLLNMVRPDVAIFGEKDYQQLQVIRRFAEDLNIGVEILGAPIVREADGLAMSSRNAYLSAEERGIAGALPRVLGRVAEQLEGGAEMAAALAQGTRDLLAAGFKQVDYLEVRDARTLEPLQALDREARLFVAARVGTTRLIDNLPVRPR